MKLSKKEREEKVLAQKQREEKILALFLRKYPINGQRIKRDVEERPEAVFQCGDKRIGIELTEYFHNDGKLDDSGIPIHNDDLKAELNEKRNLINESEKIFSSSCNQFTEVDFTFRDDMKIRSLDKDSKKSIPKQVAKFVDNFMNDQSYKGHTFDGLTQLEKYDLHGVFYSIEFVRLRADLHQNHWHITSGWWVRDISQKEVDKIQKRIDKKKNNYPTYIQNFSLDECWLLVHSGGDEISDIDFEDYYENKFSITIAPSPFDKIFFFDLNTAPIQLK